MTASNIGGHNEIKFQTSYLFICCLVDLYGVYIRKFRYAGTGKQKNPLTDAYINELRGSTGIDKVQKGSALLKGVLGRLRKGGVLAFLADLRVSPNGIIVDFLGTKASVAPGMGMFAKQTNVPIFPAILIREGWTKHRLQIFEPILPDPELPKKADQQQLTQAVFVVIERAIRKHPEQWFWYNKRWILTPPSKEK